MEQFNNFHALFIITALAFSFFKLQYFHDYMFSMPHIILKSEEGKIESPKSYIWYWLDILIPIFAILITVLSSSYFLGILLLMNKHYFHNIENSGKGSSNIYNFHVFIDILLYILILLHAFVFKINTYSILEHIILKL